jgi:hypothetical protein
VPNVPGVYAVVRPTTTTPDFLLKSQAGHFKGRDPTVPVETLEKAWVPDANVLYVGKATSGKDGRRGLGKRLDEYRRYGAGAPIGHQGGRYIWQLADADQLLVAWWPTPAEDPGDVEARLIRDFREAYGKRPFANRNVGRRST